MVQKSLPQMKQMTADVWASLTDAEKLAIQEFALMQLLSGHQRVQVRHDVYWTQYAAGHVPTLRAEVQRLRTIVGGRAPISINPPGIAIDATCPPKNSTQFWPMRYR